MNLITPNDKIDTVKNPVCETCVLTVMLGKDNKIFYYEGMPENNPLVKETAFTTYGIRKILLAKLAAVKNAKGTADDMVLIIKPGAESAFKNFVDMADEVTINNIKHYFIDEINEADKKLLAKGITDFFEEKQKVENRVKMYLEKGKEGLSKNPHNILGEITPEESAFISYKHLDHHLRQFDV